MAHDWKQKSNAGGNRKNDGILSNINIGVKHSERPLSYSSDWNEQQRAFTHSLLRNFIGIEHNIFQGGFTQHFLATTLYRNGCFFLPFGTAFSIYLDIFDVHVLTRVDLLHFHLTTLYINKKKLMVRTNASKVTKDTLILLFSIFYLYNIDVLSFPCAFLRKKNFWYRVILFNVIHWFFCLFLYEKKPPLASRWK